MDTNNIENNLRIFGASQYDVASAVKGLENFKREYTKLDIDGIHHQSFYVVSF